MNMATNRFIASSGCRTDALRASSKYLIGVEIVFLRLDTTPIVEDSKMIVGAMSIRGNRRWVR